MANRLRLSWKRLGQRAAEFQAVVVLSVLYWLIVVPIGGLRKIAGRTHVETGWKTRTSTGPVPIEEARRQS